MWYLWAHEPPQKAWLKYTVCVQKKSSKSAVKSEWKSRGDPGSQSHIYWKVNVKQSLIRTLFLYAFFYDCYRCLHLLPFRLLSPFINTLMDTSGFPSLWEEPAGSCLSCPLFFPLFFSPSPTVEFWTSNQEPLSLADSRLFIPHSQRAFFNTHCTSLLAFSRLRMCLWRKKKRMQDSRRKAQRKTKKRG